MQNVYQSSSQMDKGLLRIATAVPIVKFEHSFLTLMLVYSNIIFLPLRHPLSINIYDKNCTIKVFKSKLNLFAERLIYG